MPNLINVVDEAKRVDLDKVRNEVVLIGDLYYWKSSSKVVVADVGEGRMRYYRKNSPLIVEDSYNNGFILRKNSFKYKFGYTTNDIRHLFVEDLDGDLIAEDGAVRVSGGYLHYKDERMTQCMILGSYILKSDSLRLSEHHYTNAYVSRDFLGTRVVELRDGSYAFSQDCIEFVDGSNNQYYIFGDTPLGSVARVFKAFKDSEGDFGQISTRYILSSDLSGDFHIRGTYYVHSSILKYHDDLFSKWEKIKDDKVLRAKYLCDRSFDDSGPDENNAKSVDVSYVRERGGGVFEDYRRRIITSQSLDLVGGIPFSIGVELETQYGRVPSSELEDIQFATYSDGSIRANEYVSPVLHGDAGMIALKKATETIASHCFVNNNDALHVHIGGASVKGCKHPSFGLRYARDSIMLGLQIEEEMFEMQPASRNPRRKYCASITRDLGVDTLDTDYHGNRTNRNYTKSFWHITKDNCESVVADYVFDDNDRPQRFEDYSQTNLGRWTLGRYKWLNLVNFCSLARFKTIEFRNFSATTSWNKVHNSVLLSLAIANFIENCSERITDVHSKCKGESVITLNEILKYSYEKSYPTLYSSVNNFIEQRKEKFKRNSVYPN